MSKKTDMTMHLLVVNSMLLLENLDVLKPTSERMATLKNTLTEFCEVLNEELKNTDTVQKTTYFLEIANKVNSVIRNNFNPNM
jgi:hypothetical protein